MRSTNTQPPHDLGTVNCSFCQDGHQKYCGICFLQFCDHQFLAEGVKIISAWKFTLPAKLHQLCKALIMWQWDLLFTQNCYIQNTNTLFIIAKCQCIMPVSFHSVICNSLPPHSLSYITVCCYIYHIRKKKICDSAQIYKYEDFYFALRKCAFQNRLSWFSL